MDKGNKPVVHSIRSGTSHTKMLTLTSNKKMQLKTKKQYFYYEIDK